MMLWIKTELVSLFTTLQMPYINNKHVENVAEDVMKD